jgi:uncharacterized membrane protein (DUF441 family)
MISSRQRTIAISVSVIGLPLLVLIQALSWRERGRLNSGAFLLLIPIMGPLFTKANGTK